MDPVTHTLVGASLAETRLGRMSAYAAPTLILGANAPDMDAVTMLIDRDLALGFRRGWTHGVLAIAVLPILLTALICLLDRAVARWRGTAPRARPDRLLLLAYIAVASHPLMDWLNTYGMRFLMPFDGRWFYGDALVLLDPLVWLLSGTAVVIAHSRSATGVATWLALGGAMTLLLTLVAEVPAGTWVLWLAGLAAIAAVRASGVSPPRIQRMATLALIATGAYMLAMAGGSRLAAREVADWLTARGGTYQGIMAGPLPARPFARKHRRRRQGSLPLPELNWLRTERIQVISPPLERVRGPAVEAALAAPQVQGARNWLRFPLYTVEQRPDGYRVTIRDARYTRRRGLAFPMGVVELDREPAAQASGCGRRRLTNRGEALAFSRDRKEQRRVSSIETMRSSCTRGPAPASDAFPASPSVGQKLHLAAELAVLLELDDVPGMEPCGTILHEDLGTDRKPVPLSRDLHPVVLGGTLGAGYGKSVRNSVGPLLDLDDLQRIRVYPASPPVWRDHAQLRGSIPENDTSLGGVFGHAKTDTHRGCAPTAVYPLKAKLGTGCRVEQVVQRRAELTCRGRPFQ